MPPGRPIGKSREFIAVEPTGKEHRAKMVPRFCEKHELPKNHVYEALNRARDSVNGWIFRWADEDYFDDAVSDDSGDLVDIGLDIPIETLGDYPLETIRRMIRGAITKTAVIQSRIDSGRLERPVGFDSNKTIKTLEAVARTYGVNLREVSDTRSDLQKAVDMAMDLAACPSDLLEKADGIVTAIERSMLTAVQEGEDYIKDRIASEGDEPEDPKSVRARMDRWLILARKIRKIRRWARDPIPTDRTKPLAPRTGFRHEDVWEATHALRYMLFVGRSDLQGQNEKDLIFQIGPHIVKMCVDIWEADNGVGFFNHLMRRPKDKYEFNEKEWAGKQYEGAVILLPPRHSKTSFLRHWVGLTISVNQRIKIAYVHCRKEEAEVFCQHVASLFDDKTKSGRRNATLFDFKLAEYDNKARKIRLHNDDPSKEANLTAAGFTEAAQGKDLDILIGDDLVPQEDVREASTRTQRKVRWAGTWMTRLQMRVGGRKGKGGFFIVSGYPWHHDDLVWHHVRQARLAARTNGGQGIYARLSMQPVGGPKSGYTPIWPKLFDKAVLKRKYLALGSASVWAANYELNPITDEMKLVKEVALYDHMGAGHVEFMSAAMVHLSVDPSSTNRPSSDKTGLVRAAIGIKTSRTHKEWGEEVESECVMRVLGAEEFYATQSEAADRLAHAASSARVDYIHIEISGGYGTSLRDLLISLHGMSSIIQHKPGPRSKEQRLRLVAPLVENSSTGIRAKIEFPGKPNEKGELEPEESVAGLINQIINFRVLSGLHSLDAFTQLAAHAAPQLSAGTGAATEEVRAHQEDKRSRIEKMYERDEEERQNFERLGVLAWAEGNGS